MNGATNGNQAVEVGPDGREGGSPLEESYRIQAYLERALEWFVGVEELTAARGVAVLVENLVEQRMALINAIVERAEEEAAAALIEGR